MEVKRVEQYSKHGCCFYGKLVVVNYYAEMQNDPRWGQFNTNLTFDYLAKAKNLVTTSYKVKQTLLSMPDLVVEIE